MIASTSTKEGYNLENIKSVDAFGIKSVLKSAALFGANASGKSNLANALASFKSIILGSLESISEKTIDSAVPFLLKENAFDQPTEFEVTFLSNENMYRYGISIKEGEIVEEWLYWTKNVRETLLFHREKQTVSFNQRSFPEAKFFVKREGELWNIEKTKPFIPFISVLSQFDGEKSVTVTEWFSKLNVISGLTNSQFKLFTTELFEEDLRFKDWALKVLDSLQINGIEVSEVENKTAFPNGKNKLKDTDLNNALNATQGFLGKNKIKEKRIEIIKKDSKTGRLFTFPLSLESEGTKKLIHLLGPLYEAIKKEEILIIDEFDNKFHTLLCKYFIKLYNRSNSGNSQLILTCHDTNLLDKDLFRRDQIWFVEKNDNHESEIYSLVEYKEHYTRKDSSYSKDYLAGKYGAIPLFSSLSDLGEILNGQG
ncbi:AAA family ATPase [Endozoicomonas numazuensis]|nr:ATP-binding protein [Endozoicomonas numazuensis]